MTASVPGRVDHVALHVPHLAWHASLFCEVFGMAVVMEDDGDPRQLWLDGGIQLVECRSPAVAGTLAHVAIGVADLPATGAALERRGCVALDRGPTWWSIGEGLVVELVGAAP